jgi:hypothetical protein
VTGGREEGSGRGVGDGRRPEQTRTDAVVRSAGFVVTPTQLRRPGPTLVTPRGGAHFFPRHGGSPLSLCCSGAECPRQREASLDACTPESSWTNGQRRRDPRHQWRSNHDGDRHILVPQPEGGEGSELTESGRIEKRRGW